MGNGRPWIAWGAAVFTLSLVWEVSIYLAQAWPIYYPFVGMAVGGVLAVVGLVVGVIGRLNRSGSG